MRSALTETQKCELLQAVRSEVYPKHAEGLRRIDARYDEFLDAMVIANTNHDTEGFDRAVANRRMVEKALNEALSDRLIDEQKFSANWQEQHRRL